MAIVGERRWRKNDGKTLLECRLQQPPELQAEAEEEAPENLSAGISGARNRKVWENVERWRDITGYSGIYQVSDSGRVRSLDRTQLVANRYGGFSTRKDSGKIISATDNGHGYLIVSLNKAGKRKNKYVHRLVADAFIENPHELPVVNHINHTTKDNHAENLEWCTQRENVLLSADRMRHPRRKYKKSNTGEKYITILTKHGNHRYRVMIRQLNVCKSFATLAEALEYKKEVMNR